MINNKQILLSASELAPLNHDSLIVQTQGNFIKEISTQIHRNDLLLLPVKTSVCRIRNRSVVGAVPEAIARSHPDISILVIHFPVLLT